MAGIGFELKKLYKERGVVRGLKAFLYSFVVTVGPMMLCVFLITFMQYLLEQMGVGYINRQVFVAVIQYAFIFSLLIAGAASMYLSRVFADLMYMNRYDEILKGLDFTLIVALIVGTIEGILFLRTTSLDFITALLAYSLFMILIIVWTYGIVITAVKNYKKIFYIYLSGVFVGLVTTIIMVLFRITNANYYLFAVIMAFMIIATRLIFYMRTVFNSEPKVSRTIVENLDIYGKLVFVGFFMNAAIYVHNMVYWFSDHSTIIAKNFHLAPFYDVPMFYAFLTVIPAMVFFIIFFETNFYDRYKDYYAQIIHGGDLVQIETSKEYMIRTLYEEYAGVMQIQLFFTIVSLLIGRILLPRIGVTSGSVDIFSILTLGSYVYAAVYVCVMVQLYFDDVNGAAVVSGIFFITVLLATYLVNKLGFVFAGVGFFIGALTSWIVGFMRLNYYMNNLDYYTYCNQSMSGIKRTGFFTKLAKLMIVMKEEEIVEYDDNGESPYYIVDADDIDDEFDEYDQYDDYDGSNYENEPVIDMDSDSVRG